MNIEILEDNIEKIAEPYASIVELIVDALRTYPTFELNDTEDYFNEVKRLLKSDDISYDSIKDYLENNNNLDEQNTVWISDSLNSLIEAFELMRLSKISLNDVKNIIADLN